MAKGKKRAACPSEQPIRQEPPHTGPRPLPHLTQARRWRLWSPEPSSRRSIPPHPAARPASRMEIEPKYGIRHSIQPQGQKPRFMGGSGVAETGLSGAVSGSWFLLEGQFGWQVRRKAARAGTARDRQMSTPARRTQSIHDGNGNSTRSYEPTQPGSIRGIEGAASNSTIAAVWGPKVFPRPAPGSLQGRGATHPRRSRRGWPASLTRVWKNASP